MSQELIQHREDQSRQPPSRREALINPSAVVPQWLKLSLDAMTADYRPRLPSQARLTADQRTNVEARCFHFDAGLAPASSDEIAVFIITLQDQFGTPAMDEDALRRRQEGYLIAIEGVPAFALDEAYRRIMRNAVPEIDPRYMPKGPELRALLDKISFPARAHLVQLRRLLGAEVEESHRVAGPRALPPEVSALLARPEGERVRRRHPPNPSGVDHSAPYHFAVKGE